jgi:predicted metal-dependent phosphoesterase TrpH
MTGAVDLHLHSTASDGAASPGAVIRCAAAVDLAAIALTDHDTLAGIAEATTEGAAAGVQVVAGCEFSVKAWWGELHLLGYFLPHGHAELDDFLAGQRRNRESRAEEIVDRLGRLGAPVSLASVQRHAGAASVGRPHVARALVEAEQVTTVNEAFDRYLADGRPAYVAKTLPELKTVTALVRRLGGVTSAAHLKEHAARKTLVRLREAGVDAVEVLHPAHDDGTVARLEAWADQLALLKSGGSDWHGEEGALHPRRSLGALRVPRQWLDDLRRLHERRAADAWT